MWSDLLAEEGEDRRVAEDMRTLFTAFSAAAHVSLTLLAEKSPKLLQKLGDYPEESPRALPLFSLFGVGVFHVV